MNLHWKAILVGILLFMLPLSSLFILGSQAPDDFIQHFWDYLATHYLTNSLVVAIFTTFLATILGVSFAYLCVFYEFPARRWLTVLLAMPMAFPAYILGYVYLQIFEHHALAHQLRATWHETFGFDLSFRSKFGLIVTLSLALYPYVFLLCRNYFLKVAKQWFCIGESLGLSMNQIALRILLPGSLPPIFAGAVLVALESFADFGASYMFSVDTFTIGLFKSWLDFFSIEGAAYLSLYLILLILPLVFLEIFILKNKGYASSQHNKHTAYLGPISVVFLLLPALLIVSFAVFLPLIFLLSGYELWADYFLRLLPAVKYTLWLGIGAAGVLLGIMTLLAAWWRISNAKRGRGFFDAFVYIGYGLPGAMVGVAMLGFSQILNVGNFAFLILFWALGIRFAAAIWKLLQNSFRLLPITLDHSAKAHGRGPLYLIWHLYLPHLRPFLLYGMGILTIEIMKEMPVTLMLRPVGWDTLVVKIFEFTSEGEWRKAMLPSLLVALLGIAGFLLMLRFNAEDQKEPR